MYVEVASGDHRIGRFREVVAEDPRAHPADAAESGYSAFAASSFTRHSAAFASYPPDGSAACQSA